MLRRPRVLDPAETPDQELIVHRGAELHDVVAAMSVADGSAPTVAGPISDNWDSISLTVPEARRASITAVVENSLMRGLVS